MCDCAWRSVRYPHNRKDFTSSTGPILLSKSNRSKMSLLNLDRDSRKQPWLRHAFGRGASSAIADEGDVSVVTVRKFHFFFHRFCIFRIQLPCFSKEVPTFFKWVWY